MRKKLDTRFPASRIKKIMQADEDVGKIAMAVPLLVSKALELFLQDLCDRTYDITLQRGAKTMSSLHLKQCVQSFNVFDFLKETVCKVPDLGGSDAAGDDRHVSRRRKAADDEDHDSDEEAKRTRMQEAGHSSTSGRGRGRGCGRGRGRGRAIERESIHAEKCEDDLDMSPQEDKHKMNTERFVHGAEDESRQSTALDSSSNQVLRNFDLNVELQDGHTSAHPVSRELPPELKHEEYPGWSLADVDKMAIDPLQLAQLNQKIDEDEDYDEEG